MLKKLIINADDFGYTPGVTYGIIEAHKQGIVSSTTALTVCDFFEEAMELRKVLAPDLAVGVHLTLTLRGAKPLLPIEEVPSLVDEKGEFLSQQEFADKVDLEEVYREWDAQIARFYETGYKPDHLDSHHNVHGKNEEILFVALKLAEKYNLPLRNCSRTVETESFLENYGAVKTTDRMLPSFYGEGSTKEELFAILDRIEQNTQEATFEMNCHPAFIDPLLKQSTSYCEKRIEEFAILTAANLATELSNRSIDLVNYSLFDSESTKASQNV